MVAGWLRGRPNLAGLAGGQQLGCTGAISFMCGVVFSGFGEVAVKVRYDLAVTLTDAACVFSIPSQRGERERLEEKEIQKERERERARCTAVDYTSE